MDLEGEQLASKLPSNFDLVPLQLFLPALPPIASALVLLELAQLAGFVAVLTEVDSVEQGHFILAFFLHQFSQVLLEVLRLF